MGFGVALVVVGDGSWWIYGFGGGGFVGFWVLEVVVVVVCGVGEVADYYYYYYFFFFCDCWGVCGGEVVGG